MEELNTKNIYFSLLIPCYGSARHLHQMLRSIENENYSDYEIIICEQGETDISLLQNAFKHIKIVHLDKPSSYFSRIELFKKAQGEYVWFLDDDDEISEKSLAVLNKAIIENNHPDCILINSVVKKTELDFFNKEEAGAKCYTSKIEKKYVIERFLNTNELNTVWGKLFKKSIKPKWVKGVDVFQSDDKLLSHSIIDASNTFITISYPCYKYFSYRSHSLKNTSFKKLHDTILVKQLLIEFYGLENAKNLLLEGYQNIKSFLLNNKKIEAIDSIYSDNIVKTFIECQKSREKYICQLLPTRDRILFGGIVNKNKLLTFIVIKFARKKKKNQNVKYQHVSLGYNCSTAYNLKANELRSFASPFDWIVTFKIEDIIECIESNFANLFDKKNIYQDDTINKWYLNKKCNILFGHGFSINDIFPIKFIGFKFKYRRRIRRFYKKIQKPTIFYRYCYLEEDIDYIIQNSKMIEDFFKRFNSLNKVVYIIDETFLNHKYEYPGRFIICEKVGDGWNKLGADDNVRNYLSQFEKHANSKKKKNKLIRKIILKLSILLTRQKSPYKYKKQYKHFDVY